jgi:hypothetical protein
MKKPDFERFVDQAGFATERQGHEWLDGPIPEGINGRRDAVESEAPENSEETEWINSWPV